MLRKRPPVIIDVEAGFDAYIVQQTWKRTRNVTTARPVTTE